MHIAEVLHYITGFLYEYSHFIIDFLHMQQMMMKRPDVISYLLINFTKGSNR